MEVGEHTSSFLWANITTLHIHVWFVQICVHWLEVDMLGFVVCFDKF